MVIHKADVDDPKRQKPRPQRRGTYKPKGYSRPGRPTLAQTNKACVFCPRQQKKRPGERHHTMECTKLGSIQIKGNVKIKMTHFKLKETAPDGSKVYSGWTPLEGIDDPMGFCDPDYDEAELQTFEDHPQVRQICIGRWVEIPGVRKGLSERERRNGKDKVKACQDEVTRLRWEVQAQREGLTLAEVEDRNFEQQQRADFERCLNNY